MNIIDAIIIIIIFFAAIRGFYLGFIKSLGSFLSWIFGILAAIHYYQSFYVFLKPWILGYEFFGKILAAIIIFIIVKFLFIILTHLIHKSYHFIAIIPLMKLFNRILGSFFKVLESISIISLLFFLVFKFSTLLFLSKYFISYLKESFLSYYFLNIGKIIIDFLPDFINRIK